MKDTFVESVRISESVPESNGLVWKAVLIEAGKSKNGRRYRPEVLQAAVNLFNGVQTFTDHPTEDEAKKRPERSVKDICGWITEAAWDESIGELGAIVGKLHLLASDPITAKVQEAYERNNPGLVDMSIYGSGKSVLVREGGEAFYDVQNISGIRSVDLVTIGAAGGRLLDKIMASMREEEKMEIENVDVKDILEARPDLIEALKAAVVADNDAEAQRLKTEINELRSTMKLAECERIADRKLSESNLPDAVVNRLREDFSGKLFESADLDAAIEREKTIYDQVISSVNPKPEVHVVRDSMDKFREAFYDSIARTEDPKYGTFSSIQRAYCEFNRMNPYTLSPEQVARQMVRESWGFDAGNPLQESLSWTYVFGDTLNRAMVKEYRLPGFDDWRKIVSDTGTLRDFRSKKIVRMGYYGELPTVGAGDPYQSTASPTDEQASYTPSKYGELEDWTWEDALNDDIDAIRRIPRRLALAAKITLYRFVMNFLSSNGVTSYDSVALFDTTHGNKGTTTLTNAALTACVQAMRKQTAKDSTITFLECRPRYIVVPPELEQTAIQLRNSEYEMDGTNNDQTIVNVHKGTFDIIVANHFTDADAWYAVADPRMVPTIEIGFLGGRQVPELFVEAPNSGSNFTADKSVVKIRFVFGGAVVDHRGMYGGIPA